MRYRPRHAGRGKGLAGRRMRLLEVIDFADMPRGMSQLESDALAMPAGREAPAFDHGDLMRHVGVRRIMGDGVDAGLRHDFTRFVLLRHGVLRIKLIDAL